MREEERRILKSIMKKLNISTASITAIIYMIVFCLDIKLGSISIESGINPYVIVVAGCLGIAGMILIVGEVNLHFIIKKKSKEQRNTSSKAE